MSNPIGSSGSISSFSPIRNSAASMSSATASAAALALSAATRNMNIRVGTTASTPRPPRGLPPPIPSASSAVALPSSPPLATPSAPPSASSASSGSRARAPSVFLPTTPIAEEAPKATRKLRVLVVEDMGPQQKLMAKMFATNFRSTEYDITFVSSGQDGVDAFLDTQAVRFHDDDGTVTVMEPAVEPYDLILMDQNLGQDLMDGQTATKEIREFDQLVPIVSISDNRDALKKEEYMAAGFTGFYPKLFKPDALAPLLAEQSAAYRKRLQEAGEPREVPELTIKRSATPQSRRSASVATPTGMIRHLYTPGLPTPLQGAAPSAGPSYGSVPVSPSSASNSDTTLCGSLGSESPGGEPAIEFSQLPAIGEIPSAVPGHQG